MRIVSAALLVAVFCFTGCSKEDPAAANAKEAEASDKKDKLRNEGVTSHTTTVKAGKVIACKDWVTDPAKFAAGLKEAGMGGKPEWAKPPGKKPKYPIKKRTRRVKKGEKKFVELDDTPPDNSETNWDTVLIKDTRNKHKKSGLTSACDIIRPGQPPSMAMQSDMSKKSGMLGVLPGDPWCNLRAYCSAAVQKNYEKICKAKTDGDYHVNKELGVTACVRKTIMGKYDAYSYRLVDKDTQCLLEIRGGNSVRTEAKVRACAKMAMEQFTKATLKSAKKR